MKTRLIAFASVAAIAFGVEPLARAAIQPTFSARVEGVRVDALVTIKPGGQTSLIDGRLRVRRRVVSVKVRPGSRSSPADGHGRSRIV
jgi:hypothetical protein